MTGTSATPSTSLAADTHYYWRVTTNNPCGSTVSAVFEFDTALEYCSSPNVPIPDSPSSGVEDSITVPGGSGYVTDLNVYIRADHTYVGDLVFTVRQGSGAQQAIFDRPGYTGSGFGCSGDNIDVTLDDEGTSAVEDACNPTPPAISGDLTPNVPLSFFDGAALDGTWTIHAQDFAGGDTGTLLTWCLVPAVTFTPGLPFNDGFESGDTSAWSAAQP